MAKSLKEALLERFSDLQELGIAPSTAPVEDDGPSVVVEMGPEGRRDSGGRRPRGGRSAAYDDDAGRLSDMPSRQRTRPRRQERGERGRPPADRPRRTERAAADERFTTTDAPAVERSEPIVRAPADRPRQDRPPFAGRPGGRPPIGTGPGPGPRRFASPPDGSPRPSGVTDRLRERAEQRRRDEEQRDQLKQALSAASGADLPDDAFDKFLNDLTQEVGALPPFDRVIEAVQLSGTVEPFKVGEQIRQLYRRTRARAAAISG